MNLRVCLRLVYLLLAVLVSLPALAADVNATLKGTVSDPDGLPVPNAEVRIEAPEYIGGANSLTDDEGRYRFLGLPPGNYTVTVLHPSFATWKSSPLRVQLGATVIIDVQLSAKDTGESITVVGAAPAIDVESTHTGVVLDAEFLRDIPSGRDYQSAIVVAPGITDSGNGNPYAHGAFDSSNQYYIDGVNITDPVTNTFSMNMNYDAIDSIEVLTGGMDAEYGRSLGGAFNIVTKSGGNEFEGTAIVTYTNQDFIVAPELDGDTRGFFAANQYSLNLGGPILKDRVWFFASVEHNRSARSTSFDADEIERDLEEYPVPPRDYRSLYLYGKITAQLNTANRLWFHVQADPTRITNVFQDPYVLPSAEAVQDQGGWLASIGHQLTPNDHMLVQSQVYYQTSYINFYPVLWLDCQNFDDRGACTDDFTGTEYMGQTIPGSWQGYNVGDYSVGEYAYASFNKRYRMSANSSITYWFDLAGEHEAKVGGQVELLRSYYSYPGVEDGDWVFYSHTGDDPFDWDSYEPQIQVVYDSDLTTNLAGLLASAYVQDVYKPVARLTLRPGVRFDLPQLKNDIGEVVLRSFTVSPRFGFAYDLTGDKKTAIHGAYGRFNDNGFLGVADILNRNPSGYSVYGWDADAGDWGEEPIYSVAGSFVRGESLKNPKSDEFNIGIRREVGPNWAMDTTFVYEYASNFWEDDEVNLIWNEDGTDVIGYRNGTNEAIYRLRTPDDAYTRYTSVEYTVTKAFSDNFAMIGSYTWSRAYGTNSADQATGVFDVPEQRDYEIGLLSYDRTHQMKVAGSYSDEDLYTIGKLQGGYTLGFNSFAVSGTPYRQVVWNNYYGDYVNYNAPQDGRYRLPMIAQTDLRLLLDFQLGRAGWSVGGNCYNVFNDRTVTAVDQRYDPEATGEEQPFGQVIDRQGPRYFDLFVRGEF